MVGFLRVYMALVDKSLALVATTQSAKFFLIRFVQKSEEITSDKSRVFLLFVSCVVAGTKPVNGYPMGVSKPANALFHKKDHSMSKESDD